MKVVLNFYIIIGTLTCHEAGIRALEMISPMHQTTLLNSLLRPYEGRAWGQSNWLILRFWLGNGFAYRDARLPSIWQDGTRAPSLGLLRTRGKNGSHTGLLHHIAPSNPSFHFQKLIAELLIEDEPTSTTLINSILSQLNWAFSEFLLLLQEIQNGMQRQDRSHTTYESRQSKICSMCFELTVSLMRTLELMISVSPAVFIDAERPNSITLLNRVCQLISQVLSRVTIPPGCFQYVVDMCLPELSSVSHFSIISAAIGILLALLKSEINNDDEGYINMPKVAKILLTDPSFQIACLEYTIGDVKTPIQIQQEIPRGNFDPHNRQHIDPLTNEFRFNSTKPRCEQPVIKFSLLDCKCSTLVSFFLLVTANYSFLFRIDPTHVTANEIEQVKKLIKFLLIRKSLLSDVTLPSDDTICTICYATSISATFQPCNHQSCSSCITQHLMNTKVCFYCKTLITKVQNFDDLTIYEHTPASQS